MMTYYIDINRLLKIALSVAFVSIAFVSWGQDEKWGEEGQIQSVEIEIWKDKQITLPRANRNFEKIPPRPAEAIRPEMTYDLKNISFSAPDYVPSLRPLKLKTEELAKIYGNYISAGFGNYSSPFAEAFINTKRDKKRFLGAHFYHRSYGKGPVDGKNSASGNTQMNIFGKFFGKGITSGADVTYKNTSGYFYGYPLTLGEVDRTTIKQNYNIVGLGGQLENTKAADFNFKLQARFSYLEDHYNAKESDVSLSWNNNYKLKNESEILFAADYFVIARKDALKDAKPRNLLRLKPAFRFSPLEGLMLTVGLNAALENDEIDDQSIHVYPNLSANYELVEGINAYAGLTGDMEKVSLHSLSAENFWVNANIDIFHTNKSAEFTLGLKGKALKRLTYDLGGSLASLKDLYFFKNALTDPSKFDVVYDLGDTKRVNLFADLGLNFTEKARLNFRADLFNYSTDKIEQAWHRPTYRIAANTFINIYDKLTLNGDLTVQGGMKAFDVFANKTVTLDPAVDLGAKADYLLSKRFAVFAKFNNLLATKYPLYFNYQARGLQVLAGATWTF